MQTKYWFFISSNCVWKTLSQVFRTVYWHSTKLGWVRTTTRLVHSGIYCFNLYTSACDRLTKYKHSVKPSQPTLSHVHSTHYLQRVANPTIAIGWILCSKRGHVSIDSSLRKDRFARASSRLKSSGWHYLSRWHGRQSLQSSVLWSLILPKLTSNCDYMIHCTNLLL